MALAERADRAVATARMRGDRDGGMLEILEQGSIAFVYRPRVQKVLARAIEDVQAFYVILMPEGTDPVRIHERSLWLAELCKEEGYRFSPRLHIDLWGPRRGV